MDVSEASLAARYSTLSDEALLDALSSGPEAYTPLAWGVITRIAAARNLHAAQHPSPSLVTPPQLLTSDPASGPAGLGGWLIPLGLYLGQQLAGSLLTLIVLLGHPDSATAYPRYSPDPLLLLLVIVFELIVAVGALGCLWLFFARDRQFPVFTRIYVLVEAASMLSLGFASAFMRHPDRPETITAILVTLLACFLIIPYLSRSRRVKNTFPRTPDHGNT